MAAKSSKRRECQSASSGGTIQVIALPSWPTSAADNLLVSEQTVKFQLKMLLTESDNLVALIDEPFHCVFSISLEHAGN